MIPICSRFESVTFRESEAILTLPEVCQQPGKSVHWTDFLSRFDTQDNSIKQIVRAVLTIPF
ncbi:hypothetical protein BKD03_14610 [Brucella sp. 09RB8471]|nr:hypothetical protein BKD03_14610 [Brucella sp. 09RB8471]